MLKVNCIRCGKTIICVPTATPYDIFEGNCGCDDDEDKEMIKVAFAEDELYPVYREVTLDTKYIEVVGMFSQKELNRIRQAYTEFDNVNELIKSRDISV